MDFTKINKLSNSLDTVIMFDTLYLSEINYLSVDDNSLQNRLINQLKRVDLCESNIMWLLQHYLHNRHKLKIDILEKMIKATVVEYTGYDRNYDIYQNNMMLLTLQLIEHMPDEEDEYYEKCVELRVILIKTITKTIGAMVRAEKLKLRKLEEKKRLQAEAEQIKLGTLQNDRKHRSRRNYSLYKSEKSYINIKTQIYRQRYCLVNIIEI